MAGIAFGEFLVDKVGSVTSNDTPDKPGSSLAEQLFLAPQVAGLKKRRLDRQVFAGEARDLRSMTPSDLAAGVPTLAEELAAAGYRCEAFVTNPVVRGGLQAVPRGQYEGAQALGLNYWQMMIFIILPQALKTVIPGIVNSFIALFKDTTLVLIIGLFDLLGIIQLNFTDPTWATPQTAATGYVFAGFFYFVICAGMSQYSRYMERRLDTGHRND